MISKLTIFILTCCTLFSVTGRAQTSFSVQGIVYDSLNNERIPFVSIYKKTDKKGTLSDFSGKFLLEEVSEKDTLVFSCVGYDRKEFTFKDFKNKVFTLLPKAQITDEITVLADNSFLYELVRRVQKEKGEQEQVAKTYLELESYSDGRQLEFFQGYYNGTYSSYDISKIEMKYAKFALLPIEMGRAQRIFASTDISTAIYYHKLTSENNYFPINPFELNKRKMKKRFHLSLNKRYKDEEEHTIYVITAEPREDDGNYFTTTAWIDSTTSQLRKVSFTIEDAKNHPFLPLWPDQTVENVGIEIAKVFTTINGRKTVKTVNFDYHLDYVDQFGGRIPIQSRAILNAYDYKDPFFMPFFRFTRVKNNDFRRIQMLPKNDDFWECNDDFKMRNNAKKRTEFLSNERIILPRDMFETGGVYNRKNFFESPYIKWSENRVIMRGISKDSAAYYTKKELMHRFLRYDFDIQLFVDLNELCDSTQLITKTVYDPYTSFYHFFAEKENQVFLNIFFDLMEIERRKLHKELVSSNLRETEMQEVYNEWKQKTKALKEAYFNDVDRGTNREELKRWNEIVKSQLNIDNFEIFELSEKEEGQ